MLDKLAARVIVKIMIVIKNLFEPCNICAKIHLAGPFFLDFTYGSLPGENSTMDSGDSTCLVGVITLIENFKIQIIKMFLLITKN
jgi:hypothetical protein